MWPSLVGGVCVRTTGGQGDLRGAVRARGALPGPRRRAARHTTSTDPLGKRQRKPEAGTVRADIVDADVPLMGVDNRAHAGQAQAGATGRGGRGTGAVEAVTNVCPDLRIDARAMGFDA